ncbi:MAG: hypothetical protein ABL967_03125 [Bryobacteraceae bacterium]
MQTPYPHATRFASCAVTAILWMTAPAAAQSVDLSGTYRIQFQNAPGSRNIPAGQGGGTPRSRAYKVDGQPPPLQDWAKKLYEERIVEGENGRPFRHLMTRCLPQGMPMASLFAFYPVQLLQSKDQVTILYEEQNHFRIVRMNAQHPADIDPSFFGDSIGKWDKNTLVIDTVGIRDDTTIDYLGLPHTDQLHVVERMRKLDANTLESRITLDDPKAFTKSWEAVAIWKRLPADDGIKEYICENTRYFE